MICSAEIQFKCSIGFLFPLQIILIQTPVCLTENNIRTCIILIILEPAWKLEHGVWSNSSADNGWQKKVSNWTIVLTLFPPLHLHFIILKKKRFPEICFLDRHSLVVLNVTLSKRALERRLWMMLNVLWLPAFVSVLPRAALRLWWENLVYHCWIWQRRSNSQASHT